jgi:hypothetical protein
MNLMFRPRFVEPILAGTKTQTIRPNRKRPIAPGTKLSLRRWAGKAYRSPQVVIREVECIATFPIEVRADLDVFARGDGFPSWDAMLQHFRSAPQASRGNQVGSAYGLPFTGTLIQWARG